jgi:hypothetical protein
VQAAKSPQLMRGPLGRNAYDRSSTNLLTISPRSKVWGAALTAMAAGVACAVPPKQVPLPAPVGTFKARQEIEIWRGSQAITLHGVHVLEDSLSGVPLWQRPECDSCRIAVPLEGIDSLRMVDTERAWMILAGLPFAALGAVVVTWRLFGGGD